MGRSRNPVEPKALAKNPTKARGTRLLVGLCFVLAIRGPKQPRLHQLGGVLVARVHLPPFRAYLQPTRSHGGLGTVIRLAIGVGDEAEAPT
jgi:hypothetical protein